MSLQFAAEDKNRVSFDQLCEILKEGDSKKQAGKELRLAERSDGLVEFKVHEPKFLADKLGSKTREGHQEAARDLVHNALVREVGKNTAHAMMANMGSPIKVDDLKNLQSEVQAHHQGNAKAIHDASKKWHDAQKAGPVTPVPQVNQGVSPLLNDNSAEWSVASAGAGGALIVKTATEPTQGAILKLDSLQKARASESVSQVAKMVAQNVELPMEFTDVVTVTEAPDVFKDALATKMTQLTQDKPDPRVQDNIAKMQGLQPAGDPMNASKENAVSKMSFSKGTQLDKLGTADKIALLKNPEFAQQIGQATVLCPMFGLNDHLGPGKTANSAGDQTLPLVNASNFMINEANGKLVAIDYSTDQGRDLSETGSIVCKFRGADTALIETTDFLIEASQNKATLNGAAMQMLNDEACGETPLSQSFQHLTSNHSGFFKPEEQLLLEKHLTQEDKIEFAKNMMKGAAQGVQLVQKNIQAFANAYEADAVKQQNHGLLADNETNFMTKNELDNLSEGLGVRNTPKLVQNMEKLLPSHLSVAQMQPSLHPVHSAPVPHHGPVLADPQAKPVALPGLASSNSRFNSSH